MPVILFPQQHTNINNLHNDDDNDDDDEEGNDITYDTFTVSFNDLSPMLEDTVAFHGVHPMSSEDTSTTTQNREILQQENSDHDEVLMSESDDDDDSVGFNNNDTFYASSLGQIASVAQSQQSAARVRRRRSGSNNNSNNRQVVTGGIVGSGAPLRRQRGFYQLDVPPWFLRNSRRRRRRSSSSNINNHDNNVGTRSYDDNNNASHEDMDDDLLQQPHDYHHRHHQQQGGSNNRDVQLLIRARSRLNSPWVRHHQHNHHSHHHHRHSSHDNYCMGEAAVDLSSYNKKPEQQSVSGYQVLDFDIVMDDGGEYRYNYDDGEDDDDESSLFGVENILQNDETVYCSGRSGTINILMQYCGSSMHRSLRSDKSCVISKIIIKSPQRGYTAPCKEGLFFISYNPIDVDSTTKFDNYTRSDYEHYVRLKGGRDRLDDSDPVAWFSMSSDLQDVVHINDRVGKYVLIKLLRAEARTERESENIDLQYVAIIGFSGARAFANARLY